MVQLKAMIEQRDERNIYPWSDFGAVTYVFESDIDEPRLSDIPYIRVNNICLTDGKDKTAMIWMVYTPPELRGRGLATELMRRVLRDADRQGCYLQLFAIEPDRGKCWTPEGAMSDPLLPNQKQLMKWYRQFGFRSVSKDSTNMVRKPRSILRSATVDNAIEATVNSHSGLQLS
jgi:GNAT superfamily N-acetyltransferase